MIVNEDDAVVVGLFATWSPFSELRSIQPWEFRSPTNNRWLRLRTTAKLPLNASDSRLLCVASDECRDFFLLPEMAGVIAYNRKATYLIMLQQSYGCLEPSACVDAIYLNHTPSCGDSLQRSRDYTIYRLRFAYNGRVWLLTSSGL